MPSEKAMAKAAKIIKAPVNEKSAAKVADSGEETSSEGTSSSGSDDDATSSSGSDSASGSESSSEDEELPVKVAKTTPSTSLPSTFRKRDEQPARMAAAPPTPFQPPKGFEPLKTTSEPKASKILSNSKLTGKQIWYITAPANVPIASIKSVALRDVQKGKPVATVNGQNYGFMKDEGPEKDNTTLLVPSREGEQYVPSKRNIDQVLHLQQIVELPELMTKEKATVPAPKKFVRQQPKGLRMRFKPIGFGDEAPGTIGTDEDSDVEMEEAPRTFKKHKVTEVSDDEETPRKSKKDKEKKEKKERKEKKEKKSKA